MLTEENIGFLRSIFKEYDYFMTTKQLADEKLYYRDIQYLSNAGLITKVKHGYYEWTEFGKDHPAKTISRLLPDAVLCMETALYYYRYIDTKPNEWSIAIDKNASRQRTQLAYPAIKAYRTEPHILYLGEAVGEQISGIDIRIYDRDRTTCDILRNANKLDEAVVRTALQKYSDDPKKNVVNLLKYAKELRVYQKAIKLIGSFK